LITFWSGEAIQTRSALLIICADCAELAVLSHAALLEVRRALRGKSYTEELQLLERHAGRCRPNLDADEAPPGKAVDERAGDAARNAPAEDPRPLNAVERNMEGDVRGYIGWEELEVDFAELGLLREMQEGLRARAGHRPPAVASVSDRRNIVVEYIESQRTHTIAAVDPGSINAAIETMLDSALPTTVALYLVTVITLFDTRTLTVPANRVSHSEGDVDTYGIFRRAIARVSSPHAPTNMVRAHT
jgi:hypothetical protein